LLINGCNRKQNEANLCCYIMRCAIFTDISNPICLQEILLFKYGFKLNAVQTSTAGLLRSLVSLRMVVLPVVTHKGLGVWRQGRMLIYANIHAKI
jgi:hypothetical protein